MAMQWADPNQKWMRQAIWGHFRRVAILKDHGRTPHFEDGIWSQIFEFLGPEMFGEDILLLTYFSSWV
jgi:hypothetical protein